MKLALPLVPAHFLEELFVAIQFDCARENGSNELHCLRVNGRIAHHRGTNDDLEARIVLAGLLLLLRLKLLDPGLDARLFLQQRRQLVGCASHIGILMTIGSDEPATLEKTMRQKSDGRGCDERAMSPTSRWSEAKKIPEGALIFSQARKCLPAIRQAEG